MVGVGALVLATGTLADPARERFRNPPPVGQLPARDAVAARLTVAHVVRPGTTRDRGARMSLGGADAGLPDFAADGDVAARKAHFFRFLLPLVQAENVRLTAIRTRLGYIYDHVRWQREIGEADRAWLAQVTAEFRLGGGDPAQVDFWLAAFDRVDGVPEDLVLVQAANESAWGTSRFAREGNNLFGQWCFRQGCGIVPAGRPTDATYEVARFGSVSESIGSYMRNLNTGRTYRLLREIRARRRGEGAEPDALAMAAGLMDYSARGIAYVDELQAMIRHNAMMIDELRQRGATNGNS